MREEGEKMLENEKYPVDAFFEVVDGIDIYKSAKWWKAVILTRSKYGLQVATYQWIKNAKTGKWKRKQKMGIKSLDELDKIYNAIKELLAKKG